jgi:hypothetical protein
MPSVAHDETTEIGSILSGPLSRVIFRMVSRAAARCWTQFEALPKPTRKDQLWRFANVDLLNLTPFKFGEALPIWSATRFSSNRAGSTKLLRV